MANAKKIAASIVLGGSITGALRSALGSATDGLKKIGAQVDALTKRQRLLSGAVDTFGRQGKNIDGLRASYAGVTRELDRLKARQQSIVALNNKMGSLRTKGRDQLGRAVGMGASAVAIGATVSAPLKAFEEQDTAMNNMTVAMTNNLGKLPAQFEDIKKQTIELGNLLPGTTADFVNVATSLKQLGVPIENISGGALKAAAHLAVVLQMDPTSAAETVAKYREAFQLHDNELPEAADLMQRGRFAYGLTPEDLKTGAQYAGAPLQGLGVKGAQGVKQSMALQGIAMMNGVDSSTFGTSIRQILTRTATLNDRLSKSSKEIKHVNAELKSAGISLEFFDKKGQFMGVENLVGQLEKLQKLNPQARAGVLSRVFGQEAMGYAQILSRLGKAGYQAALDKADHEASLDQRIDIAVKSFKNTKEALFGTITNALAAVGQPIAEMITPWINKANAFIGGPLQDWVTKNKELVKDIAIVLGSISGILALGAAVNVLAYGVTGISKAFTGIRLAFTLLRTFAVPALEAVGAAIAGASLPVMLLVGALVVGAALIYKYWQPIKAWFSGFGQGIATAVGPALERLGAALAPLKPAWDAITEAVKGAWNWLVRLFEPVNSTKEELAAAKASGMSFGKAVGKAMAAVVEAVAWVIEKIVAIGTAIGEAVGWVAVKFPAAWESLKTTVGAVIDWLMAKIQPLIDGMNWVGNKAKSIGQGVTDTIAPAVEMSGKAWRYVLGQDGPQAAGATAGAALPSPTMATARGGAGTTAPTTNNNTFNITQQPGEDSATFARRVARELDRQNGIKARGQLVDGAHP